MIIGNYIFSDWEYIEPTWQPFRPEHTSGWYERKVTKNFWHMGAIQIYESFYIDPGLFVVNENGFPFSEQYFKLCGRKPFSNIYHAKESVDKFLIKMGKLHVFI